MKFRKFNSIKEVNVNIHSYSIDWNKAPSKGQLELQKFLYPYWKSCLVCAEFRIPGSLMRVDILNLNKKIAIEYSPSSSHDYNPFFHGNKSNFLAAMKRDMQKREWLESNGYKVADITEEDLQFLSVDWFKKEFDINI